MHVIFRESHGLEETDTPMDLGQSPADLVVLSFSDSDLGAFAAGWHLGKSELPKLRLANLVALRHPLSVDTYIEQTLSGAKAILVRLIGGQSYWAYGLQQLRYLAQEKNIALAVLPADGRADPALDEISTLPISTLRRLNALCDTGGAAAARAALGQLALAAGLYARPRLGSKTLPSVGAWDKEHGLSCPACTHFAADQRPKVVITLYRSYVTAADLDPIEALCDVFDARGVRPVALFVPSLKQPEAALWLERQIKTLAPKAVLNATAFSGIGTQGRSPLDGAEVPVFQVALSTSTRKAWHEAERGLSPSDLAMHVVLPEVDGRLSGGVISFKQPSKKDPDLEYSRFAHQGEEERIAATVDKVMAHIALAQKPRTDTRLALVLSTYPGKEWQMAHAVGLDALASCNAILEDLAEAEYRTAPLRDLPEKLRLSCERWSLKDYESALKTVPDRLVQTLYDVWGAPEADPAFKEGTFQFTALKSGKCLVALQPERGFVKTRDAEYHDTSRTPRHSYVAFYLWLRHKFGADAMIHIGAHGTLEWLPGKSVALSNTCWPDALVGALPVVYPFIVNDPGEAAQAKRRIGALSIGHIPPALKPSATPDRLVHLEALLDEFSNADGLDPKRRDRLQGDIRNEAKLRGVEEDLGLNDASSTAEAITRIDRFVCDIKESQFGDGLHIFGCEPETQHSFDVSAAAQAEKEGLRRALRAKRVAAGPSGSPFRGRLDVLPTGRNLYTTDPRSVPTRAAYAQGVKLAEELVRKHLQDNGDYPRALVVDLWGSATMRTAGEEFAMALHLLGVKPKWDAGSERVNGVEILPIAELSRPRLDVTLRVSGLFRDVFANLSALFSQAIRALSERDEALDWNPFVAMQSRSRVFGPKPGSYGLAMGGLAEELSEAARQEAGEAWLAASAFALDGEGAEFQPEAIAERVRASDSFVHLQDLPETDLLMASDYVTHEAGFAAAQKVTGGSATLYHLDNTRPDQPKARGLAEEVARVVQSRAINPNWIAGMKRHGFRGAAEIAATLDHMAGFANLAGVVGAHHFEGYFDATLGDPETVSFLKSENPEAYEAMKAKFQALLEAGLWTSRRNSTLAVLESL